MQDTIEYMTVCVCEFYEKIISHSVSEAELLLSIYIISTDQSKDDYHLETAGNYVLNKLLVVSLVCLSVFLSVFIGPDSVGVYSLFVSFVTLFVCYSPRLSRGL